MQQCLNALEPQLDRIVIVDTNSDSKWWYPTQTNVIYTYPADGINISAWWNLGLKEVRKEVEEYGHKRWDVAIINDDVIMPEGWFDAVSGAMRGLQAAAGCSGGWGHMPELHTHVGPVPGNPNPLQGFAFMVAGEKGLRANEDFRWYWSDNFIDWESRKLGGTVVVPGFHVQHLYPNGQVTPEMQVMIAEDAQKFSDLYGMRPW